MRFCDSLLQRLASTSQQGVLTTTSPVLCSCSLPGTGTFLCILSPFCKQILPNICHFSHIQGSFALPATSIISCALCHQLAEPDLAKNLSCQSHPRLLFTASNKHIFLRTFSPSCQNRSCQESVMSAHTRLLFTDIHKHLPVHSVIIFPKQIYPMPISPSPNACQSPLPSGIALPGLLPLVGAHQAAAYYVMAAYPRKALCIRRALCIRMAVSPPVYRLPSRPSWRKRTNSNSIRCHVPAYIQGSNLHPKSLPEVSNGQERGEGGGGRCFRTSL